MIITQVSPISGKTHVMDLDITNEQLIKWGEGMLIQNAFPNLTPSEREFIKTGITSSEWDSLFK